MRIHEATFLTSAVDPGGYPPADRPEIAFAGRSNVGKSTLINALCGRKALAKVSQTPGKTRLINFFDIDERFYLVDLPGFGYAKVSKIERRKWAPMMGRYLESRDTICAVVLLVDLRRGLGDLDLQLLDYLDGLGRQVVLTFTKADKLKGNARRNQVQKVCREAGLTPDVAVITSGSRREGLEALWQRLEAYL
ncbi:MAG: ribosome biogenesis GTP-binding protein YihA/YsxC [Candidatus Lernaella stagnicola]|nr:ribosome biogenesis GTP-binding protein YihA/YsxC [Candidatus Lernaella stagnicola]